MRARVEDHATFGRLSRDFGFAGDFVEVMHLIVQNQVPSDYVVGTGHAHSIADFCEAAFNVGGLDWRKHVVVDDSLLRKVDSHFTRADSSKLSISTRMAREGRVYCAGHNDGAGENSS